MSKRPDIDLPPPGSRFVKGKSGNPKGRPRKPEQSSSTGVSAFDIILDRTLPVVQGGVAQEMTVEVALQLKTYQQALAGSRLARKTILKMIQKREAARAKGEPGRGDQFRKIDFKTLADPSNADAAMLILDIARHSPAREGYTADRTQLLLEPWAVQAALSRRRASGPMDAKVQSDIHRCTRNPESLRWPRGSRK